MGRMSCDRTTQVMWKETGIRSQARVAAATGSLPGAVGSRKREILLFWLRARHRPLRLEQASKQAGHNSQAEQKSVRMRVQGGNERLHVRERARRVLTFSARSAGGRDSKKGRPSAKSSADATKFCRCAVAAQEEVRPPFLFWRCTPRLSRVAAWRNGTFEPPTQVRGLRTRARRKGD